MHPVFSGNVVTNQSPDGIFIVVFIIFSPTTYRLVFGSKEVCIFLAENLIGRQRLIGVAESQLQMFYITNHRLFAVNSYAFNDFSCININVLNPAVTCVAIVNIRTDALITFFNNLAIFVNYFV